VKPIASLRALSRTPRAALIALTLLALVPVTALAAGTSTAGKASSVDPERWSRVQGRLASTLDGRRPQIDPDRYLAYTLDGGDMQSRLATAPAERSSSPLTVSLPSPDGNFESFAVTESAVMQAGLAAKHPEISTYAGRSLDNPDMTVRMDYSPLGFHASVRGPAGLTTWYIDPYYRGDTSRYVSYYGDDLTKNPHGAVVENEFARGEDAAKNALGAAAPKLADGAKVKRRTYRLALLTDPTYAQYFGKTKVTAAKVALMNRVNQIYEDDLAIRMVLINATDKLNLNTKAKAVGAYGPCGAASCYTPEQLQFCDVPLLLQNRIAVGQIVGASKYDIGHIGLGVNGGGIAGLGVVGGRNKPVGCTGLPEPVGDFYAVDYVAHEMGHQFAGTHTFNGTQANCAGANRAPKASVEPGSGSSVMAYAGICLQDDLQRHTDPYFSQRSIKQITGFVSAALPPISEIQNVSLRRFDKSGDSFRLKFNGKKSKRIVKGNNYNKGALSTVLKNITGAKVTVRRFGGGKKPLTNVGFQVSFAGSNADKNVANLKVRNTVGSGKALVGETARGGPVDNHGHKVIQTNNSSPIVAAPPKHTIPKGTPFILKGSGADADGDKLTYLWEQNDRGGKVGTSLVDNTKKNGPLFRQFGVANRESDKDSLEYVADGINLADGNPARVFPDMAQVLNGNTNAKTGRCPTVDPPSEDPEVPTPPVKRSVVACFSEFLPTADYQGRKATNDGLPTMHFRLTARDMFPGAGGTDFADTALRVDASAGPFLVTSHKLGSAPANGGQKDTVKWAVKGTDTSSLAPKVRIKLSTNGGKSFKTVLAKSTRNDGSQVVDMPKVTTNKARIKIEAVGNVFFDVNDSDFKIN